MIRGLTDTQVTEARAKFGPNVLLSRTTTTWSNRLLSVVREPMVILLLCASVVYFISGELTDALFMLAAIVLVSLISVYQEQKADLALTTLNKLNPPMATVIREGQISLIKREDVVAGDTMLLEEGKQVPADGLIVESNDLFIDESILTGESAPVYKNHEHSSNQVSMGTIVTSGRSSAVVTAVGNETRIGRIGLSIEKITSVKSPLENQLRSLTNKMMITGGIVFLAILFLSFGITSDFLGSLLTALTLAMSIIPEEILVAYTSFMALGAWRLMKQGIIVKNIRTVETLGAATVICVDKTGTITENNMQLTMLYAVGDLGLVYADSALTDAARNLITTAMWASEPIPFDPMEKSIHAAYKLFAVPDQRPFYSMYREYPLGGIPPMMTHVFRGPDNREIVAAKGAPEAFLNNCELEGAEKEKITTILQTLTRSGYRVLGVAQGEGGITFPEAQQDIPLQLKGLLAFYDPPKKNIANVLQSFYNAGIGVKMITGDNLSTAESIASQVKFKGATNGITGDELLREDKRTLAEKVNDFQVFSRMYPEAKLRIIEQLKTNGEIVAMTGDGVNDGPALKAASIGIAMGKKGTEIARDAAGLILIDDDLGKMVDAIAMGRRIQTNLRNAIRYIISIHIPIILIVLVPLLADWQYAVLFSPVHIIFLELVMGPTCSIVFENEPISKDVMARKPRTPGQPFLGKAEMVISMLQGLAITVAALAVYWQGLRQGLAEEVIRTMVFVTLISANIFLTLVNRSFYHSMWSTLRKRNLLMTLILFLVVLLTAMLLTVRPLTSLFGLHPLTGIELLVSFLAGFLGVSWFEVMKLYKRRKHPLPYSSS
ncbi:MAG: cation-translocating P-type ATPase [Chitinophagaceae bacterium]|nr:MAG: cation-translocating P-type ATPase [Chitinophagaceae bacterium]